jgi:hypothetical protein
MNRDPIDHMHDLKEQIDRLKAEYDTLRRSLINGEIDPNGDEYSAQITEHERRTIRLDTAGQFLMPVLLDQITTRTTTRVITFVPIDAAQSDRTALHPDPDI